jgi:RNA polymerase primary sigma factor
VTQLTLDKLIAIGKEKGQLTYDEVNQILPEEVVSSGQIDEILSILEDENIQLVEDAPKEEKAIEPESEKEEVETEQKAPRATEPPPAEAEEEVIPAAAQMDDPVRMYLRQMGQISLLTREQEIELAKRIEQAENKYRETVFTSRITRKLVLEDVSGILKEEINFEDAINEELKEDKIKTFRQLRLLYEKLKSARKKETLIPLLFSFNLTISFVEEIALKIKGSLRQIDRFDLEIERLRRKKIRGQIQKLERKKKRFILGKISGINYTSPALRGYCLLQHCFHNKKGD